MLNNVFKEYITFWWVGHEKQVNLPLNYIKAIV